MKDKEVMQDIEDKENIIEISHLKKYYKEVKAVDDVSFSVKKGELFGFLGVNGAGKSTTINMLCTLFPPTDGKVKILGMELGKDNEKIKRHIGVVYQNNCLDEPTTGLDPATRKSVWETVYALQKEMDMTVFLTTHYMEEAAKANHIGIMEKGHLIQFGTPFSLKDAFAKDRLRLMPKEEKRDELLECLRRRNISYHAKDDFITITLNRTMEALPYLTGFEELIRGFEVIQGTMDDVFLNVTEGEKTYA